MHGKWRVVIYPPMCRTRRRPPRPPVASAQASTKSGGAGSTADRRPEWAQKVRFSADSAAAITDEHAASPTATAADPSHPPRTAWISTVPSRGRRRARTARARRVAGNVHEDRRGVGRSANRRGPREHHRRGETAYSARPRNARLGSRPRAFRRARPSTPSPTDSTVPSDSCRGEARGPAQSRSGVGCRRCT